MATCKDCVAQLLGACNGDYCYTERVGLVEQAERLATERGHTLSPFQQVRGSPLWVAHCEACGREIAYTLDPEPGTLAIYGEALDEDCPEVLSSTAQELSDTEAES